MMEWENTKVVEANLGEYVQAQMHVSGWGRERVYIAEFFKNCPHIVVEEHTAPYQHNLSQVVMKKFFEEVKGFSKIGECNPDNGDDQQSAVFEEIEIDYGQTVRGYSDACVSYKTQCGDKLLVCISRQEPTDVWYRIMGPEKWAFLLKEWFNYAKTHNFYKGKKITASCGFMNLKDYSWDDVILPDDMIHLLKSMIPGAIERAPLYLKNKVSLKRGIMMAGKPGTGKSTVLKVVAKESPITVIYAQPSNLMNARDVRAVCSMARDLAPCIFIIEDIDWIAEDRETGDAGRVIELMNQLDGVEEFNNVITIATTNDVEKIEGAVKNRPGRFDRVINIENPNEDCRRRMVKLFTKDWQINKDVSFESVVKFTDGLSGAHMHDLCVTAAVKAIDGGSLDEDEMVIVQQCHFEEAVKEVKDKDFTTYQKAKSTKKKTMGFRANFDDDDL